MILTSTYNIHKKLKNIISSIKDVISICQLKYYSYDWAHESVSKLCAYEERACAKQDLFLLLAHSYRKDMRRSRGKEFLLFGPKAVIRAPVPTLVDVSVNPDSIDGRLIIA